MPTPKYLFTTYTSAYSALATIDTWLVNTMGYTRNLAPTADSVTYTGYKAHYQFTFVTGETIYLNFHTDTTNSKLYLTTSRAYASGTAWNAQTGTAQVLSNAIIYGRVNVPTASSNNALYLFGDAKGNCQVFIQRGSDLSVGDLLQWGLLDKSGFGTWTGGCFFDSWVIGGTTLSIDNASPMIINSSGRVDDPVGSIDIAMDSITTWAAIKTFAGISSDNSYEPPSMGSTSSSWSSVIVGAALSYTTNRFITNEAGANYCIPASRVNVYEGMPTGFVNMITGKISLGPNPTIYARHEATQRLSPIGRMPFGYHCPIAGFYRHVAPGTQLVQDGRTFIMMGNIAAEMVSV